MTGSIELVLSLCARGLLTKQAAAQMLAPFRGRTVKLADWGSSPYMDAAKIIALQAAVMKGIGAVEGVAGKAWNAISRRGNDALFQKLMNEHPAMQGKDVARAKANFDYIVKEAPHLIDHPMILGDYVGNMTALKTTDPATLKTIAETEKARIAVKPQNSGLGALAAKEVSDVYKKQLELENAPSVEEQIQQKALEKMISMKGEREGREMAQPSLAEQVLQQAQKLHRDAVVKGVPPPEKMRRGQAAKLSPEQQAARANALALSELGGVQQVVNDQWLSPELVERVQSELADEVAALQKSMQSGVAK